MWCYDRQGRFDYACFDRLLLNMLSLNDCLTDNARDSCFGLGIITPVDNKDYIWMLHFQRNYETRFHSLHLY